MKLMTDQSAFTDRPMFFNADGAAITMREWSLLFSDKDYKVLERTPVDGFEVITVWMGTDQGDSLGPVDEEPPLIFGTIGYSPASKTYLDHLETFAATATQARANHGALVTLLAAIAIPDDGTALAAARAGYPAPSISAPLLQGEAGEPLTRGHLHAADGPIEECGEDDDLTLDA